MNKTLKRILRIAKPIRELLTLSGKDQSMLEPGNPILDTTGVIYAIFNIHGQSKKIYVGQTINTPYTRYQQHIRTARDQYINMANDKEIRYRKSLYQQMRLQGHENFLIIPLEKIYFQDDGNSNKRKTNFRETATPREIFWIERLRSWQPYGYNVEFSQRRRTKRRTPRASNPMKWRREKQIKPIKDSYR